MLYRETVLKRERGGEGDRDAQRIGEKEAKKNQTRPQWENERGIAEKRRRDEAMWRRDSGGVAIYIYSDGGEANGATGG